MGSKFSDIQGFLTKRFNIKIQKRNIVLAGILLLITYCSTPFIFNTAIYNYKEYEYKMGIHKFDDLEIHMALVSDYREHSLNMIFFPYIGAEWIRKEPFKLHLQIEGKNLPYTHVLVKYAEIKYSYGKIVTLKQDDAQPLKLPFKEYSYWENGKIVEGIVINQVFHYFEKLVREKHSDGQRLKATISLTVMPGDKPLLVEEEFIGKTYRDVGGFWSSLMSI
jgi:hypothetical protein